MAKPLILIILYQFLYKIQDPNDFVFNFRHLNMKNDLNLNTVI